LEQEREVRVKELAIEDFEQRADVIDALASPFDFSLRRRPAEPVWFRVDASDLVPIAGDASGGVFSRLTKRPFRGAVLYVSSEGLAGIVGHDLREWLQIQLQILLGLPLWVSVLHFSGHGCLPEMRKAQRYVEADDSFTRTDWKTPRLFVSEALGLVPLDDPVGALHRSVSAGQAISVTSPSGWQCESLFGSFVVEDDPRWKKGGARMS
jgi:hypothetical protein